MITTRLHWRVSFDSEFPRRDTVSATGLLKLVCASWTRPLEEEGVRERLSVSN